MRKFILGLIFAVLSCSPAYALQKNVSGQKWIVFAFDRTDNTAKTGDAANITANLRIDGGEANAVDDTNPAELEDGYYAFDVTQAETNGDYIVICPASATSNIQVIGCPGAAWTTSTPATLATIDGKIDALPTAASIQAELEENGASILDSLSDVLPATTIAAAGDKMDIADNPNATGAGALSAFFWGTLTTANNVEGSYGETIEERLDAQVSSRSSHSAADVWTAETRSLTDKGDFTLTSAYDLAKTASQFNAASDEVNIGSVKATPVTSVDDFKATGFATAGDLAGLATSAEITALNDISAADVWDVTLSEHLTAGTTGNALNAAGSAGDPWSTTLPGAYGAGSAGYIVGTNLNAAVSSRSSHSASDVWAVGTRALTDKADFTLTSAYDAAKTAAPASTALDKTVWTDAKAAYLDEAISGIDDNPWDNAARTLTAGAYSGLTASDLDAIWEYATTSITTSGGIGKQLKDNVDTTTSSRMATFAYTAPDNAGITAIQAKTDNLPDDPADASVLAGLLSTVQSDLDNPDQYKATVSGLATANGLTAAFTEIKGATWSAATDTLEAIRDRGDSAWITSTLSAANIKTALEADGSKLDHLWEMTEDDGGVRRLTENALEQAPSGSATGDWTTDEKTEIKAVLGVTGTGTPDDTPSDGALKKIQDEMPTPYNVGP